MTISDASANRRGDPARVGPDLARRLLSLTGVFPLGAFLFVHLALNMRALGGEAAFARAVRVVQGLPALAWLEWIAVLLPLAIHACIGLWVMATPRARRERPGPYPRAWRIAMRATALGAAAFLVLHLPELRFRSPGSHLGAGELATVLAADLSSTRHGVPWRGAAYLLGAGCVTFHFAAGLWAFFADSRAGRDARARRWAAWAAVALGGAMWLLLADVVLFHATGSRLFGSEPSGPESRPQCPVADVK